MKDRKIIVFLARKLFKIMTNRDIYIIAIPIFFYSALIVNACSNESAHENSDANYQKLVESFKKNSSTNIHDDKVKSNKKDAGNIKLINPVSSEENLYFISKNKNNNLEASPASQHSNTVDSSINESLNTNKKCNNKFINTLKINGIEYILNDLNDKHSIDFCNLSMGNLNNPSNNTPILPEGIQIQTDKNKETININSSTLNSDKKQNQNLNEALESLYINDKKRQQNIIEKELTLEEISEDSNMKLIEKISHNNNQNDNLDVKYDDDKIKNITATLDEDNNVNIELDINLDKMLSNVPKNIEQKMEHKARDSNLFFSNGSISKAEILKNKILYQNMYPQLRNICPFTLLEELLEGPIRNYIFREPETTCLKKFTHINTFENETIDPLDLFNIHKISKWKPLNETETVIIYLLSTNKENSNFCMIKWIWIPNKKCWELGNIMISNLA